MKNATKILAFLLTAVLAISLCACGNTNVPYDGKITEKPDNSQTQNTEDPVGTTSTSKPSETDSTESTQQPEEKLYTVVSLKEAKVGDIVVFGSYEQDGDTSNGKEPLEWLVLADNGGIDLEVISGSLMEKHPAASAEHLDISRIVCGKSHNDLIP